MPVKVVCPNPDCQASYSVADELLGRRGRCKQCGTKFSLEADTRPPGHPPTSDLGLFADQPEPGGDTDLPSPFGRYRIVRKLGQGGMGAVYLAHDTELDRPVALKVPHAELSASVEFRERFQREARAAAGFHHPNFCPIYDVGSIDGRRYLAMAYIEGQALASLIQPDRPIDQRRAAEVVRTLALALAEAHRRGIIHRDLKPANIMIDARGALVLMDFGLARRGGTDDEDLTLTGAPMGTPAYMPPEQVEGDKALIGPASDIYSLGVILYELLTGRRPFQGPPAKILVQIVTAEPPPPSLLRPDLAPTLEEICRMAMAKKVSDRFATMEAFATALEAYLATPTKPVGPDMPFDPRTIDAARMRMASTVGTTKLARVTRHRKLPAAVVLLGLLGVGIWAATGRDPQFGRGLGKVMTKTNSLPSTETTIPKEVLREPVKASERDVEPVPPPAPAGTLINPIGMRLVPIPAGEFLMGSPDSVLDSKVDERPAHRVRIASPFYLGMTEVTQGQYRAVMGQNPSQFAGSDDKPVETVSWNEAVEFCNKLSEQEGLRAYYQFGGHSTSRGDGYRLPTEAEWEYACRAETRTRYYFGDDAARLDSFAGYDGNSGDETHVVGQKRPNAFGLYDMHGNVWEWCWDRYDESYYLQSPIADPIGPSLGAVRVVRGGSWGFTPLNARAAHRYRFAPMYRVSDLGFRVARARSGP